jgi:hypothetical protein
MTGVTDPISPIYPARIGNLQPAIAAGRFIPAFICALCVSQALPRGMLPTSMKVFGRDRGVIATRLRAYPIFVPILPAESLHVATTIKANGDALAFAGDSHLSPAIQKDLRVDHHGGNCAADTATGSHAGAILCCIRVFPGGADRRLA